MRIRRMTEADLGLVVFLERKIFPDPWSYQSFHFEVTQNSLSLPLILEDEENMLGYAIIWRIYEEFHIANIAIHPDYQDQKLGTRFMENILSLKENCAYAILEVRESNQRAIHLYRKFGFQTIMKRPRYYRNGETALVMQKIFSAQDGVLAVK